MSVKQFRPRQGLTKCSKGVSVWSPNGTSIKLGLACKIRGGNPLKLFQSVPCNTRNTSDKFK